MPQFSIFEIFWKKAILNSSNLRFFIFFLHRVDHYYQGFSHHNIYINLNVEHLSGLNTIFSLTQLKIVLDFQNYCSVLLYQHCCCLVICKRLYCFGLKDLWTLLMLLIIIIIKNPPKKTKQKLLQTKVVLPL